MDKEIVLTSPENLRSLINQTVTELGGLKLSNDQSAILSN